MSAANRWAAPTDGRPVTLTLRVENDGSAPTPPGVLRLYDGAPEDGGTPAAPDAVIPGLAAGGAVDVEVVWETLDRSGSHTLVAVLDPESATEELSETDNRTSVDLEVAAAPDAVDLQVTASEVLVTPSQPVSLPAELTVAVTVRNLGRADAPDALVRLGAGAVPGAGALVEEKRVAVPGRSSTVVGFSHLHDPEPASTWRWERSGSRGNRCRAWRSCSGCRWPTGARWRRRPWR